MTVFAQISVNVPQVSGVFDYRVPDELCAQVAPGSLVVVPFGKQVVQGVILSLGETSEVLRVRDVSELLDPLPVLTAPQLKLAKWMAEQTFAPLAVCLDQMLPPGLAQQSDTLYALNPLNLPAGTAEAFSPLQKRILALIERRGPLRGRQLEAAFPRVNWKESARALTQRAVLVSHPVLPPPAVHPKLVRTVQLACPPDEIAGRLEKVGRAGTAAQARRAAMVEFLRHEPWPVDVTWAYAAAGASATFQDLERLEEAGLVRLSESEVLRDPLQGVEYSPEDPPELTAGQRQAWEELQAGLRGAALGQSPPPYLLHGVTGSGKTEIYLRAVEETLRLGRQALVLVPEIALTGQTARRFLARFPGQVGLTHSRLSPGERYDTWRRARAGLLPVIVGPRSALFTPMPDLGLIVLDECHDDSYRQTEIRPFYDAVQSALLLGRLSSCAVVLGSATPGVAQVSQAEQKGWRVLRLPLRILAHRKTVQAFIQRTGASLPAPIPSEGETAALELPPVRVVDMRQELKSGNRSIFSRPLQNAVTRVLAAGQQAILYLNRKGAATYVFCRECGYSLLCPRCDLPLTLHTSRSALDALTCHTCGYRRQVPKKCPQCGGTQIRQYGTGTEKVESELRRMFPTARVLRWDAESVREKGSHEILLAHFINHQADLLVGTQMLAKGLDLPLVTLVGVILAEVGLNLEDYRAGERTFQLLTQVAGRAGRSPLGGEVILQTFQPDHYVIQAAAGHDFDRFLADELGYRRRLSYPPFTRLVRLEFRGTDGEAVERSAAAVHGRLQAWLNQGEHSSTLLTGPVPCFFARQDGRYRWQIILRGPDPAGLLRSLPGGLSSEGLSVQVDPPNLL